MGSRLDHKLDVQFVMGETLIGENSHYFWMARFLNFTVVMETPRMCFQKKKKKILEEEIYFLKECFQDEAVFFGPRKVCAYHDFQRKHHTFNFFMFSEF